MDAPRLGRRSLIAALAALMIAMFVGSLDQTIVSAALPTIAGEMGAVDHMLWVTTAYFLSSTVSMPAYGKLGDIFGRKPLFCMAQVLFITGSLACALGSSMGTLILGRAVQGLGGGGQIILSQAIVADLFPPKERGKCLGIMGAAFGVSMALGPLLGGLFTEHLSWRWCFWINVPLGLIALGIAARCLSRRDHNADGRASIDVAGIVSLAAATCSLVLALSLGGTMLPWNSPATAALAVVFIAAASAFVAAERRAADPLVPLSLFRNRNFTLCTAAGLIVMVAMTGVITYLPTYFQIVDGLDATAAGYMTLPLMGGMMIASTAAGFITGCARSVKWMPLLSCATAALALGLLRAIAVETPLWQTGLALFLLGSGIGIGQQTLVLIAQNEFSVAQVGTVTAANNFFREVGGTVGASLVGALFTANLGRLLADYGAAEALAVDPNALTPGIARALDEGARALVQHAYNDALAPVFGWLAPLVVLAFALLLFLKKKPLATENR